MMDRHPRIACIVPFCGRGSTRWAAPCEIICGKHYRMSDLALRRRRTRVKAMLRKRGEWEAGPGGEALTERAQRIDDRLWAKIKLQAIERAAGITG